nr:hypothetical protein [Tanacetum cinerariifolium]
MTVKMGKQNSLNDTTVLESFHHYLRCLRLQLVMPLGFFLGKKVAYPVVANYVRNTWGKYALVLLMFSSSTRLFSVQFSSIDGLDAMIENGPCFGSSIYARVLIELHANVELKDNIVVAMPKISREGYYTCIVHVEYDWQPPRCPYFKVFRHVHEECTKNTGAGEKKTVKKPSQTSRGVLKRVEPTIHVSYSNPFDVLNSVNNDGEFGTNEGTNDLVNNEATSSGSSFRNIDNYGECASNTPIRTKINKIERQISEGKLRLLDNDGNPLVPTGIMESDTEVELVFDDAPNLGILTRGIDGSDKGYGTNSLLEQ